MKLATIGFLFIAPSFVLAENTIFDTQVVTEQETIAYRAPLTVWAGNTISDVQVVTEQELIAFRAKLAAAAARELAEIAAKLAELTALNAGVHERAAAAAAKR